VQIPPHAAAAACIQLYSRIWEELESIPTAEPRRFCGLALEILRLDLVLLIDACDMRWRFELTARPRISMRAVLVEVLELLAAPADEIPQFVPEAQDCLLDAVLEESRELDEAIKGATFGGSLRPLCRRPDVTNGLHL
jgi:hypothetical protein